MKAISELTEEIKQASKLGAVEFMKVIKSTSNYHNNITKIQANFKPLKGTEKQIEWASKIRAEKALEYAYKATVESAIGTEKGKSELSKEFAFLFSMYASTIIENR